MIKEIKHFLLQDFNLLNSIFNKVFLIACIGIYSAFFIGAYSPFNINQWGNNYYWQFLLIGIAVISTSQFLLRPMFGLKSFKIYSLILWGLFEMLLMSSTLHFLYAIPFETLADNIYDYLHTIWIVCLVATVPYVLVILYFGFKEKLATIKDDEKGDLGSFPDSGNKLLTILGENNKVIIAIKHHRILYVKSAGNYLEFYYLKGGELAKELIRARLKEVEERIVNTNIVKVHRSYLVNVRHISSLKKTKKGYEIIVQHNPDVIIPVSTSFKASFEESLKQKVTH